MHWYFKLPPRETVPGVVLSRHKRSAFDAMAGAISGYFCLSSQHRRAMDSQGFVLTVGDGHDAELHGIGGALEAAAEGGGGTGRGGSERVIIATVTVPTAVMTAVMTALITAHLILTCSVARWISANRWADWFASACCCALCSACWRAIWCPSSMSCMSRSVNATA